MIAETIPLKAAAQTVTPLAEDDMPGIIPEIGNLPPGALVTEEGLAKLFGKCVASVKNAINRGELPPPVKFMGKYTWTIRKILEHHEARLDAESQKITRLRG